MFEQGKAAERRAWIPAYRERYIVGHGLDVGAGPDPITKYKAYYPRMKSCRAWDLANGDGMLLRSIPDESFDFVVSSHCLEHLETPMFALASWLRVLVPGGHMVVTVPDEDMYERGQWPSRFGEGHKHTFTMGKEVIGENYYEEGKSTSWSPVSINILDLLSWNRKASLERCEVLRDYFDETIPVEVDQTMGPAECAIEFVLRKR